MLESRLLVGNVEIIDLIDAQANYRLPLGQIFPNTPTDAWAPYQERYPEVFDGPETWHIPYGCYLLRSQGRTILVDTGVGSTSTNPEVRAYLGTEEGRLLADLQTLGVRPEDVDTVFFTHLHPDHVGWNLRETGTNPRPTFPRARYIIHKADRDFFGNPQFQEQLPFQY
jgi:glyoxylase-like metal-dependent hydrolase (beta-lactamase superfamily II)